MKEAQHMPGTPQLRRTATTLAALALSLAAAGTTATPATAADTSCDAGVCIWSGPDFTGTKTVFLHPELDCHTTLSFESFKVAPAIDNSYPRAFPSDYCNNAAGQGVSIPNAYDGRSLGHFDFGTAHSLMFREDAPFDDAPTDGGSILGP